MIYQLTYLDAEGAVLLETTFSADEPYQALEHIMTVPSLQPPTGTESIQIQRMYTRPEGSGDG